jgi:hypothetical protein
MSETVETVAPEPAATPEVTPAADLASAIGAAWDAHSGEAEPEGETTQRDERGRFTSANAQEQEPASEEQAEAAEAPRAEVSAQPVSPVDEILETYKPLYAARGIPADQAVRSLFEAQKVLETRPVEAIQVLARQYGVDLRQFAPQPQQQAPAPAAQPQANDPVSALQKEVGELKQFILSQQQKAQEAETQTVEQSIQSFASDPKHPHFPAVRTAMGALMQAGVAKDMPSAYDMACRAHPEVWKAIQAAEAETKAKADAAERAKAAAAARSKAVSVRGSVPVPGAQAGPKDLRSMLNAAWDQRLN